MKTKLTKRIIELERELAELKLKNRSKNKADITFSNCHQSVKGCHGGYHGHC